MRINGPIVLLYQWSHSRCLYDFFCCSSLVYSTLVKLQKAREVPGIKIFHYGSSLYYANAEHFTNKLLKKTRCDPQEIKRKQSEQKRQLCETVSVVCTHQSMKQFLR
jgi:MFS superfamily sulfate permease-like transporter